MQDYMVIPNELIKRFQSNPQTVKESRFQQLQNELGRILQSTENDNVKLIQYTQVLNQLLEEQKQMNAPLHIPIKRDRTPTPPPPPSTPQPVGPRPTPAGVGGSAARRGVRTSQRQHTRRSLKYVDPQLALLKSSLQYKDHKEGQRVFKALKDNSQITWDPDTGTDVTINNKTLNPAFSIVDYIADTLQGDRYHNAFDKFVNENFILTTDGGKKKKKGGGGAGGSCGGSVPRYWQQLY